MKQNEHNKKTGFIGEEITCRFLVERGYKVVGRNYLKPCGEIDIIAIKEGVLHFVEVKTVSCESPDKLSGGGDSYRPEDNIHPWKLSRLSRTIQVYLSEKEISEDVDWVFDVATVCLDEKSKKAKISFINEIVL